jgi:hypothetical protein
MRLLSDRPTVRLSVVLFVFACRGDSAPAHPVPGDRGPAIVV